MIASPHIAVLTPYGPSRQVGGVEVFNECLRRSFGNVEIFGGTLPKGSEPLGALRRIGLGQPVGALKAARTLLRRHREAPFDVILSNGVYGWPLTLMRPRVPLIQAYHFTMAGLARTALSLPGDRLTTGRVTALFDRAAGIGKHVVAVSHRVLHEVESYYRLRGRFIPNGVDARTFRPMNRVSARERLGLPQGVRIGIFVGRPEHAKGYDILLRVAGRMPRVLFLAAGGGGRPSGNVRPIERIPHEEMPLWYSACDFFFMPSRYEGFSLSLLEALACDLPVVVSQAAWPFPEAPKQCGVAVPGTGEEEFARAIQDTLESRGQFSPREFIVPRYEFETFRQAWRGFVDSLLDAGS